MEEMYLVFRVLRKVSDGKFSTEIFTYDSLNSAKHQRHQIMVTYAYGYNDNYDYVSSEIRTLDGRTIDGPEIDNRIPQPEKE